MRGFSFLTCFLLGRESLYLDADCIVVGDLTSLWRFDMGTAAIAAVHDPNGARLEREVGIDVADAGYVSSGVMLMNLAVWRREKLAITAMAFAKEHNPLLLDQPGINVACAGKIAYLAEKWNFQLNKPRRPEQWIKPSIVHFAGPDKPWIYNDVPFGSIYFYHRNQTPFRIKPPSATHRSKLRRLLNLLIGRRKYWDQLIIARRSKAFAAAYFNRQAGLTA